MTVIQRILGSLLLLLIFTPTQNALSEVLGTKWPKTSATFLTGGLPLGGPASGLPGDSETWRESVAEAANRWNDAQSAFKLVTSSTVGSGICQNFGDNNLIFLPQACNSTFGAKTLAVTASWSSGSTIVKSDIIFNSNQDWGIYDGTLRFTPEDFRRVTMHELGHAMGLAHTTTETALMFTTATNTYLPTPDDVESLESIYKEEKDSGGISHLLLLALGIWGLRLISAHKKAD